jgi:hypothetical protein
MKKLNLRFEDWDYRCGDGCCYEYGTDIFINGKKVDFSGGGSMEQAVEAVLTHLGYKVELESTPPQ